MTDTFKWPEFYEDRVADCGEYPDDGNRATFPEPNESENTRKPKKENY